MDEELEKQRVRNLIRKECISKVQIEWANQEEKTIAENSKSVVSSVICTWALTMAFQNASIPVICAESNMIEAYRAEGINDTHIRSHTWNALQLPFL